MIVPNAYAAISKESWIEACQDFVNWNTGHLCYDKDSRGFLHINKDNEVSCRLLQPDDERWRQLSIDDIIKISREHLRFYGVGELKILYLFLKNLDPALKSAEKKIQRLSLEIIGRTKQINTPGICKILLAELSKFDIPKQEPAAWLLDFQINYYHREIRKGETETLTLNLISDVSYFNKTSLEEMNKEAFRLILRELKIIQKSRNHQITDNKLPANYEDSHLNDLVISFKENPDSNKVSIGNKILQSSDNYQTEFPDCRQVPAQIISMMITLKPETWEKFKTQIGVISY